LIAAEELARRQGGFTRREETVVDGERRPLRRRGRRIARRSPAKGTYLTFLVVSGVVAFLLTSRSLAAVNEGYRLGALQKQLAELQREHEGLELQLAEAQDLGRIRQVAVTKLGMKEPDRIRFASVSGAADSYAYGFRTDLPGGSQAEAPTRVSPTTTQVAAGGPSGLSISDAIHRILRWLTTMRQARADSWD